VRPLNPNGPASPASARVPPASQRDAVPFALADVSGLGLRTLALLAVVAAVFSRAVAPALPGTAAGIERWIALSRIVAAVTSAQFFVLASLALVWLALASLGAARLPLLLRVTALPVSFTIVVIGVASTLSNLQPRWLLWLAVLSGLLSLLSAPRALAVSRSRATGLLLALAGVATFVDMGARLLAVRAGQHALASWFFTAQVLATCAFGLELAALFVVALWASGRRPGVAALGAGAIAAVAIAVTAAGARGTLVDARPIEVLVARAFGELARHPRPLVPLAVLHAVEVSRYALALLVLARGRNPLNAAALALAVLAIGSADVPACALMLTIAALVAPLESLTAEVPAAGPAVARPLVAATESVTFADAVDPPPTEAVTEAAAGGLDAEAAKDARPPPDSGAATPPADGEPSDPEALGS
jgi:hypothetical protein